MESVTDYCGQYWKKGWVVVEGVFRPEEAGRIATLALGIAEKERDTAKPGYNLDVSDDGTQLAPRKIENPFLKNEECRKFVLDERLTGIIKSIIRERPLLCSDQIFMKPPRHGSAKPYHQDNFYFRCHPDDQVITAWIALDDVDVANGCLRYIDGSHLGPILPHNPVPGAEYNMVPAPELIDLSKESLAPVRKGGVVFHHSKTLHTSHRNESDRWRRGYASHWATAQVTSEINTLDNAYFKSKEFSLLFS
jgi:ectoine hydroxylase-related dioxygenase (phytanoyl-CoA dioxygenase family)